MKVLNTRRYAQVYIPITPAAERQQTLNNPPIKGDRNMAVTDSTFLSRQYRTRNYLY